MAILSQEKTRIGDLSSDALILQLGGVDIQKENFKEKDITETMQASYDSVILSNLPCRRFLLTILFLEAYSN